MFLSCALVCNGQENSREIGLKEEAEWDVVLAKCEGLYEQGKYDECLKLTYPLANKGLPAAQNAIGALYMGKGNIIEARKWYERAIKQNNVSAMYNMGLTYDDLNKRRPFSDDEIRLDNIAKAKEYYQMAMFTLEDTKSKYDAYKRYAAILFQIENKKDEAVKLIRDCLRNTERADLRTFLGDLYEKNDCPQDAFRMYRIAAEYGDMRAMYELGGIYMNPDNLKGSGVAQNYEEAIRWFTKIAEINDPKFTDFWGSTTQRSLRYLNYIYAQLYYQTLNENYLIQSIKWGCRSDDIFADDVLQKFYDEGLSDSKKYKNYEEWISHAKTVYSVDSDVDVDVPIGETNREHTYVLIVANENYEYESVVPYASRDGNMFFKYCNQLLGVPKENIRLITNATLNKMKHELNWLADMGISHPNSELLIYYAGHGIPAEDMSTSYLLPTDGFAKNAGTAFDIKEIIEDLNKVSAKKTLIFDACFTGAKRDGRMLSSARGVAIKQTKPFVDKNTIVISACSGVETAYAFEEQQHGIFTYYLLKGLKDNKGNVTIGKLFDYVTFNVKKTSMDKNGKIQTPNITVSTDLAPSWRGTLF